jgi:predicted aldo/keto reductase-like oxidoreductase
MKRRDFLRTTVASVPAINLFSADLSGIMRTFDSDTIEKRSLGKTGEMLSVIGFGGITVMNSTPGNASQIVAEAISRGINYFDVAPSYGNAEIKLGPALEPYRKNVFLACKTGERSRKGSRKELEQSLKNLKTDHFDLYQLHAVTTMKDVDSIFAPGGAIETFREARDEGKVRFLGFSAHSVEAALALMDRFDFDTILFPVNYVMWNAGNFGPQALEKAKEKNMGVLALKSMAKGPWKTDADKTTYPKCWYEPLTNDDEILTTLRFTLSHPVTALIPPGEQQLFRTALNMSDKLNPMNEDEIRAVKEKGLSGNPLFRYPAA